MTEDFINSIFPFIGSIFVLFNIKEIIKDKEVKGVNLYTYLFFYTGYCWNIYFMYKLEQWYSFFGGILLFTFNLIWLLLAVNYKIKQK